MSDTLEEAKRLYLEQLPIIEQLSEQMKASRKIMSSSKRVFRKYLKDNRLTELRVGSKTFGFEQKEKIVCTIDRMENAFPADQMARYKEANLKRNEAFVEL